MSNLPFRDYQPHTVRKTPMYKVGSDKYSSSLSVNKPSPDAVPEKYKVEVVWPDGKRPSMSRQLSCTTSVEAMESVWSGLLACHVLDCRAGTSKDLAIQLDDERFATFCYSHYEEMCLLKKLPLKCRGCDTLQVCEKVPEDALGSGGLMCPDCVEIRSKGGACFGCSRTINKMVARCFWCEKVSCARACRGEHILGPVYEYRDLGCNAHPKCFSECEKLLLADKQNADVLRLLKRRRVEKKNEDNEQAGEQAVVWSQVERRQCERCKKHKSELQAMEICGRCSEE